jgi:hypothetical protein
MSAQDTPTAADIHETQPKKRRRAGGISSKVPAKRVSHKCAAHWVHCVQRAEGATRRIPPAVSLGSKLSSLAGVDTLVTACASHKIEGSYASHCMPSMHEHSLSLGETPLSFELS